EQLKELYRVSAELTAMYVSIHLVRLDERTSNVIVLAGDGIEAYIYPNGEVRITFWNQIFQQCLIKT
ncbi:MAG: hypothetical protein AAFQ91_29425, partial [Cyanobacteria bacterium J06621_15]